MAQNLAEIIDFYGCTDCVHGVQPLPWQEPAFRCDINARFRRDADRGVCVSRVHSQDAAHPAIPALEITYDDDGHLTQAGLRNLVAAVELAIVGFHNSERQGQGRHWDANDLLRATKELMAALRKGGYV